MKLVIEVEEADQRNHHVARVYAVDHHRQPDCQERAFLAGSARSKSVASAVYNALRTMRGQLREDRRR